MLFQPADCGTGKREVEKIERGKESEREKGGLVSYYTPLLLSPPPLFFPLLSLSLQVTEQIFQTSDSESHFACMRSEQQSRDGARTPESDSAY